MYTESFKSIVLVNATKVEEAKTFTANWYIIKCLPEIIQEVNVMGFMIHHDNASSHSAKITIEFLGQNKNQID